jgi:hypothetical protein
MSEKQMLTRENLMDKKEVYEIEPLNPLIIEGEKSIED